MARKKASISSLKPTEVALIKADVQKLANLSRWMIRAVATILILSFAFLVLTEPQIVTILKESDPGVIYKIGLFLYYSAWVLGTKFDVDIEERVYLRDQAKGVMDWKALGAIALLTAVMVGFFWLHRYERYFGFGLIAFILANIFTWKIMCGRVRPVIADSEAEFERLHDFFGREKVRLVSEFICGGWQMTRFAAMLVMAVAMVAVTFAVPYLAASSSLMQMEFEGMPVSRLVQLAPAILFVAYVAVAEAWMWMQRLRVGHCVNVMDELATSYQLEPKLEKRPPAAGVRRPKV